MGKRPTEKLTQAVQALLSPASPPPPDLSSLCGTRGLLSTLPGLVEDEDEVVEVGIPSRLLCISVGLSVQASSGEPHNLSLSNTHDTSVPSLLEMPVSPCPLFSGHRARVALMRTVSMLVLVRLSSHVGRSVARCPPPLLACYVRTMHAHTQRGWQPGRMPS